MVPDSAYEDLYNLLKTDICPHIPFLVDTNGDIYHLLKDDLFAIICDNSLRNLPYGNAWDTSSADELNRLVEVEGVGEVNALAYPASYPAANSLSQHKAIPKQMRTLPSDQIPITDTWLIQSVATVPTTRAWN